MKYCSNCKTPVKDKYFVCQKCGYIFPREDDDGTIVLQDNNYQANGNNSYQNNYDDNRNYQNGYSNDTGIENGMPNQQIYINNNVYQNSAAPVGQLKTNRGLLKFILLSMITFGIYGIVVMSSVSNDINVIASRYDGKKTMHYCLLIFLIAPITLGIGAIVWMHKLCNRIGNEIKRRRIDYDISASTFWLWGVLGSLIIVGPFILFHKLFTAMNMLSENYNANG